MLFGSLPRTFKVKSSFLYSEKSLVVAKSFRKLFWLCFKEQMSGWPSRGFKTPCYCVLSHLVVSESATLWTVAFQAPLSMRFSRQEYWSGLPFPSSGDLPNPGIEPASSMSPALQADSFLLSHWRSPCVVLSSTDIQILMGFSKRWTLCTNSHYCLWRLYH